VETSDKHYYHACVITALRPTVCRHGWCSTEWIQLLTVSDLLN